MAKKSTAIVAKPEPASEPEATLSDVTGEAGLVLETVQQTRQPYFIPRYPYTSPHNPERGITYWDAAMWPIDHSSGSGATR